MVQRLPAPPRGDPEELCCAAGTSTTFSHFETQETPDAALLRLLRLYEKSLVIEAEPSGNFLIKSVSEATFDLSQDMLVD